MKIFSRKAFATAAAAAFVTTGAFAASPAFAETTTPVTTTVTAEPTTTVVTTTAVATQLVEPKPFNEASSGPEDEDGMDRFSSWMKVVTAVIGILTGLIALATQAGRFFS